jgi:hypothetical protein
VLPFVAALSIFGGPSLQASEPPQSYSDSLTPTIEKLLRVHVILTTLEQDLEKFRLAMQTQQAVMQPPATSAPQQPIVINNIIPKASKKVGTIGQDELGNTTLKIDNVEE